MEPTKIDLLFAAKAVSKEINSRVKALEDEVKAEFVEEYEKHGTDRKRSPMFGAKAGYLTMKDGSASERVTRFQLVNQDEFVDWMDENRPETDSFAQANMAQFAEHWFRMTGECPDGCTVVSYDTEPGSPTPCLTVKEKVVLPMLSGNNLLSGEVNQLLLGEGDD